MAAGFKVADDTPGPAMDPTSDERVPSVAGMRAAHVYLARRFPDLAAAPLVGSEVCRYESTPDSHFIIDRHPADPRIRIAGGGSGHGFKMGPAIGEIIASAVLDGSRAGPGVCAGALPPGAGRRIPAEVGLITSTRISP